MLFIVTGVMVFLFFAIKIAISSKRDGSFDFVVYIVTLLCISIITTMVVVICLGISNDMLRSSGTYTSYQDEYLEIASVKNRSEIHGEINGFFLGFSGSINSEEKYHFFIRTNKGLRMWSLLANYTYVIEDDNTSPRWVTRRFYKQADWFKLVWVHDTVRLIPTEEYLIVPKNTVKIRFNIE